MVNKTLAMLKDFLAQQKQANPPGPRPSDQVNEMLEKLKASPAYKRAQKEAQRVLEPHIERSKQAGLITQQDLDTYVYQPR
jgi:hypothetical protein